MRSSERRAPTSSSSSRTELGARFPWLAVDDLALGSLGLSGEGWFDGYALLQAFRRKARSLGVEYVAGEVVGLRVAANRVVGATLADGTELDCGSLVDAAGPWAAAVAAMAGVELPVEARRRCIFVFDARRRFPDCPLVIDPSGAWFRPEGDGFIGGTHPPDDEDAADLPLEVDRRAFEEGLWPLLAARVPAFEAVKVDERLGRLLRGGHVRPQRDPGPPPGDRQPVCSPTGSAATASSRRPPSVGPSPSSSPTAAT